jgi:hypothetical protein
MSDIEPLRPTATDLVEVSKLGHFLLRQTAVTRNAALLASVIELGIHRGF